MQGDQSESGSPGSSGHLRVPGTILTKFIAQLEARGTEILDITPNPEDPSEFFVIVAA